MVVTVFRARLRPESVPAYAQMAQEVAAIAVAMPGYVSHKLFVAEDGERLTLVEFDSEEALRAWSTHPEHIRAKKLARSVFYAEYNVQVCNVIRQRQFKTD